jgi:hypothetical protein
MEEFLLSLFLLQFVNSLRYQLSCTTAHGEEYFQNNCVSVRFYKYVTFSVFGNETLGECKELAVESIASQSYAICIFGSRGRFVSQATPMLMA